MKKLLLILLLLFPVHGAWAELPYITLHDYKIAKNTKEFQTWISGWMAGAGWINSGSKFYNGQFVFCLDPHIVKSGDFLSETLEKYFQKRPIEKWKDSDPMGKILFAALVNEYPCNQKR